MQDRTGEARATVGRMSFEVPEHVRPIRDAVLAFMLERVEPAAGDHGVIVLRVTDHGSGMDAMAKSRAFERYFSRVVTQEEGASGLGLFLAHELVTRTLGGSCELLDTPGGGLTVQLTLPMMAG